MILTKTEQAQIKAVVQSPQWSAVELLANRLIEQIKDDSVVCDSEWETLKKAVLNEGKTRGIREFIQEIYKNVEQNVQR